MQISAIMILLCTFNNTDSNKIIAIQMSALMIFLAMFDRDVLFLIWLEPMRNHTLHN